MARDNTAVKCFLSTHSGAPVLSGTAGSRVAVLDACLVTGWGTTSATQIVVAGGVATASFASGHPFAVGQVLTLAGGAPIAAGEYRVREATGSTIVFGVDDSVANQTIATGPITFAVSPGGWTQLFEPSGTLRVYRSAWRDARDRAILRVDDSAAQHARVRGYESMTDANTGTGPYPTDAQVSGGHYWRASATANNTARAWAVVTDGAFGWLAVVTGDNVASGAYSSRCNFYPFGVPLPWRNDDVQCAVLGGGWAAGSQLPGYQPSLQSLGSSASATLVAVRGATQAAGAVQLSNSIAPGLYGSINSVDEIAAAVDAPPLLWPRFYGENSTTKSNRGLLPGLAYPTTNTLSAAVPNFAFADVAGGAFDGRRLLVVDAGFVTLPVRLYIDTTGPWGLL